MAFHIKNPEVERKLRALADSSGLGLTDTLRMLVDEEIARRAGKLPLIARCQPLRQDIGLGDYKPTMKDAPAAASAHYYKFAPGRVLADILLGEDAGAYAEEIDAAQETSTGPHAVQLASEILIERAGLAPLKAQHGVEALIKIAGIKMTHVNRNHLPTVLRLRAALKTELRNFTPTSDEIMDEAYRLTYRVAVVVMGHHPAFPELPA